MLRTSRVHPKISAFHCLEGVHDFNRVPFAPPGQRATIFNSPETRPSWGPRALDAWYANPAWHHYRCWEFYVPSTGGFRISGQANFYPQHSSVPQETDWDSTKRLAHALTQSLRRIAKNATEQPGRHMEALKRLTDIFANHTNNVRTANEDYQQTSSTSTTPAAIRKAPRVQVAQQATTHQDLYQSP